MAGRQHCNVPGVRSPAWSCLPSLLCAGGLVSVLASCEGAPSSSEGAETGADGQAPTTIPLDGGGTPADGTHGTTGDDSLDGSEAGSAATSVDDGGTTGGDPPGEWDADCGPPLGARRHVNGDVEIRVVAPNATRIEVAFFGAALGEEEALRVLLQLEGGRFEARVPAGALSDAGLEPPLYYGLRAFGPNWPHDARWSPGSEVGRLSDVDGGGNRYNPNKLLLDPYALELSHDPRGPEQSDTDVFRTDVENRARDSGPFAPKGVVVECASPGRSGPQRPFRDEVIYEVHLRGLTMGDSEIPARERGTYAGAARRAESLAALGVTAIELLPLHETPNDQNELTEDAAGDNYWGYSSMSFFAPDRRFAADKSPGGPTAELRAMVQAFHDAGIKVYADVVYNHTAEGGANGGAATVLSWRGLDNATFYELDADGSGYVVSNGVGPNVNTADPVAADLVLDSLHYMHEQLGFDGFRFDLAAVVANGCVTECYEYDAALPERIATELSRDADGGPGVDLIAEAWGAVAGTYQVGNFPEGWAEWNDRFRDGVRRDLNRLDLEVTTLRELSRRVSGSPDLYDDDGRPPAASVNFVVAHDGMTLGDLFRYDDHDNDQRWPYGPSSGGTDNDLASSHGDDAARQATVTRTAAALLAVSAGVPMMTGGDEYGRTLRANNNPFNLDNAANWLLPEGAVGQDAELVGYTAGLWAFRAGHVALRPAQFWDAFGDGDGNGLLQVRWLDDDANPAGADYLDADANHFLAWMLDGEELGDASAALYFAYNGWSGSIGAVVPDPPEGTTWRVAIDTSTNGEDFGWVALDGAGPEVSTAEPIPVAPRSLLALVAE